jgi:hypothetical protein
MTVIAPGKMKAVVKVEESQVFAIKPGMAATVKPAAVDSLVLNGKTATLEPLTAGEGGFPLVIELAEVDPRLMPGMKVKAELEAAK